MPKQALPCQGCLNHGEYCQYCRDITKAELAAYLREEIPIYLSERNRAKHKKIGTLPTWVEGKSCREAAKLLGVSAQTISRRRREEQGK